MSAIAAIGPLASTGASLILLLLGVVAILTMMARLGRADLRSPGAYTRIHRVAGWGFTAVFAGMFLSMLTRLGNYAEEFTPRITVHITLAIALLCLLAIKVSVPRFFPQLGKHLFPLGIGVFLLAFPMALETGGYFVVRSVTRKPYVHHGEFDREFADSQLGKEFLITKCSVCHVLETILKPRSEASWGRVVERMVVLAHPRISSGEASQILAYLSKNFIPRPIAGPARASLVGRHCLPCHTAVAIFKDHHGPAAWRAIVERMSEIDPTLVAPGQVGEIVQALVRAQEDGGTAEPERDGKAR